MRSKETSSPWGWVLFALVVLIQIWVVFVPASSLLNWFTTDDAFYYFKVAQNIAEGQGSTFDGLHLTNGYHPLWMLVCVPIFALARFSLILPLRLIVLVSILLTAGTSAGIYRLLARWIRPQFAMLAGFAWAFIPLIADIATLKGMEAGVNAFFVTLLLERIAHLKASRNSEHSYRRYLFIGVIGALAVMSRLDNIFILLAMGIWLIFDRLSLGYFWLGYLVAAAISVLVSFFLRLEFVDSYPQFLPGVYSMLGMAVLLKPVLAAVFGLSSPGKKLPIVRLLAAIGSGTGIVGGGMILLTTFGVIQTFPRTVILYDMAVTAGLFLLVRWAGSCLLESRETQGFWPEFRTHFLIWLKRGLAFGLPIVLILGSYMLWSHFTFGTSSPVSGQVKHWWGTLPDTVYGNPVQSFAELFGFPEFLDGAWQTLFSPIPTTLQRLMWPLPVWGIFLLAGWVLGGHKHGLGLWSLGAACLLQVLYYHGSYYIGMRSWYWLNESLFAVLVWAMALDGWWGWLTRQKEHRRALLVITSLCSLVLVANYVSWTGRNFPLKRTANDQHIYLTEAVWLEKLTPPGSVIGMSGSGSVGYFINDRRVVNLDGLINSNDYFQSLKAGTGRAAVDAFGLDYVYGHYYLLTSTNPYYNILKDRLDLLETNGDQAPYRYVQP